MPILHCPRCLALQALDHVATLAERGADISERLGVARGSLDHLADRSGDLCASCRTTTYADARARVDLVRRRYDQATGVGVL